MRRFTLCITLVVGFAGTTADGAEEWLQVLTEGIRSEYSQTRQDALKQVDVSTAKGLKALWSVLGSHGRTDPLTCDWYVREGAQEALSKVETEEAKEETARLMGSKGNPLAKEAVIYSVIRKIRKDFIKDYSQDPDLGDNEDRRIEKAKQKIRKTHGIEYISLLLPRLNMFDPDGVRFEWIKTAFGDKDMRVRLAALHGLLFYPQDSTVPLLIENMERMKALEAKKKKSKRLHYREWLVNRFVLEQLSGQSYYDVVEDWKQWWDVTNNGFSLQKRVDEELGDEKKGKTIVVRRDGVEVKVNMKIAGKRKGYPLLVLPWDGYEPDYFRPYFHGIEDFMRVYYLFMPQLEDFKGLVRGAEDNMVRYPTKLLAKVLAGYMEETGLERLAVMAHGQDASSLAMHLASAYAEKISHLILISPRSAGNKLRDALLNVQKEGRRRKNQEVVHGVDNYFVDDKGKPNYEADDAETRGIRRAIGNLKFADPTAPEVSTMDYLYKLPGGVGTMNDNTWSMKKLFSKGRPRMHVLVCMGERNPWTPVGDMQGVAKFLGAKEVRFRSSSEFPFLFETYEFTRQIELFFKRNPPPKKSPGKPKKKRSKKKRKKKDPDD